MTRNCCVCNCKTTGVPTFRVTQNRLESWGVVLNKILKIGDRICQSHFSKECIKKEDIIDIKPNKTAKVSSKIVHTSIVSYKNIFFY